MPPDSELFQISVVARVCNVTPQRLRQLALEGHVPRADRGKLPLLQTVTGYIKYLQQNAAKGSKKLDEESRLKAAQADLRTLELARARSEVVSSASVIHLLKELQPVYFSDIDAMPARLTPDLVGCESDAARIRRTLEDEVKRVRQAIHDGLVRMGERMVRRSLAKRSAKKKTARRVGRQRKSTAARAR